MNGSRSIVLVLIFLTVSIFSCTSRYRLDLTMTLGSQTRRLDIESTQTLPQTILGNPLAEQKVMRGEATTLLVRGSTRGMPLESAQEIPTGLSFDEYLKVAVYIELPDRPEIDTLALVGRSIVQVLERYDQPPEEKVFLAVGDGEVSVDSIAEDYLYATIDGRYENRSRQLLVLSGQFRTRMPE